MTFDTSVDNIGIAFHDQNFLALYDYTNNNYHYFRYNNIIIVVIIIIIIIRWGDFGSTLIEVLQIEKIKINYI